jgi:DNA repair protein RecO (recombination protein O)
MPVGEKQYLSMLYVNELIISFLPVQESSPELFRLYSDLVDNAGRDLSEKPLRSFERSFMQMLGYLPDTGVEATSGERIQSGGYYHFIASSGFVACDKTDSNAISGESIIAWNHGEFDNRQVLQMAKTVMRYIIDFNLHGKTLKSRDIYRQIKART